MSSTPPNSTNNGTAGAPAGTSAPGTSPTFSPLYQQIKALITKSLQSGEWKPGELIPSEIELANRFKVSQGTVRKAIDELAAENLVVRRQGKGTFVATHHEARAQFRFLRLMPDEGEAHSAENKIIEVKRLRAPAEVARQLDMKSGDSVVYIKRVQSFDGHSVQGPDRRTPQRVQGTDVWLVRNRIRHPHDSRIRKNPRSGRGPGDGGTARHSGEHAIAERGEGVLHLWGQAGRGSPRLVQDRQPSLSERIELSASW
jgi:DNA-binding transcriptional regulator YhcF (GntR family)